jgi:outer membrane murein-binding lipoprotein Lpp
MTTDNIILEHLRHIRAKVDQTSDDIADLKQRMGSLESAMVAVKYEVVHCAEVDTRQQVSIDKIIERIQRIERRLELND